MNDTITIDASGVGAAQGDRPSALIVYSFLAFIVAIVYYLLGLISVYDPQLFMEEAFKLQEKVCVTFFIFAIICHWTRVYMCIDLADSSETYSHIFLGELSKPSRFAEWVIRFLILCLVHLKFIKVFKLLSSSDEATPNHKPFDELLMMIALVYLLLVLWDLIVGGQVGWDVIKRFALPDAGGFVATLIVMATYSRLETWGPTYLLALVLGAIWILGWLLLDGKEYGKDYLRYITFGKAYKSAGRATS